MGKWETQAKKASSRISFSTSTNERFSSLHLDKNKSTNSHKSFRDKFMFFSSFTSSPSYFPFNVA